MMGSTPLVARAAKKSADTADGIGAEALLNALNTAVIAVDADMRICQANAGAENVFRTEARNLAGQSLLRMVPGDSPLLELIAQVRAQQRAISEYGMSLEIAHTAPRSLNVHAAPLSEWPGVVVLSLESRALAEKLDRQRSNRGAVRSLSAMASLLAHEVKNPLSGIRGAAQLLEAGASAEDQNLTRLIRDEVDRICILVDRMDMFADDTPASQGSINIHRVLDHVHQIAKNGFGYRTRFVTRYDPSLPPVLGDRDQLVQVFLNLFKNAVEASPEAGGEVTISTSYRHDMYLKEPFSEKKAHLPLVVSIVDRGEGIPEDIRGSLFNPFITSKPQGSGLGLALVAKIIDQHGGIIECDSRAGETTFRVMLPMYGDGDGDRNPGREAAQ